MQVPNLDPYQESVHECFQGLVRNGTTCREVVFPCVARNRVKEAVTVVWCSPCVERTGGVKTIVKSVLSATRLMVRIENEQALGFFDQIGYEVNEVRVLSRWLTEVDSGPM